MPKLDTSFKRKRQIIAEINKLDLRSADYYRIKELVDELIAGVVFENQEIIAGQKLFRARVASEVPKIIDGLASPRNELVKDFQRCNPPGQATFYCSSDCHSAMREVNIQVKDIVYVSHWIVKQNFLATSIVPKSELPEDNQVTGLIATFFETKFTHPVHEVFSRQYKVTAAIFEQLLSNVPLPFENDVPSQLMDRGVNAVVYPSIANSYRSDCVALKPEFAKKFLRLDYAEERMVNQIRDNEVRYDINRGTYVFRNNSIDWPPTGRINCRGDQKEHKVLGELESRFIPSE